MHSNSNYQGSVPFLLCFHSSYYHRSLDIKKLVDIGFARVPHRLTMAGYSKYLRLPDVRMFMMINC